MHSKCRRHNFSHIGRTLMYWMLQTTAAAQQAWYKSVTEDREKKWLSNVCKYYLQFSCLLRYYNQNIITHIPICVFIMFVFDMLTDLYMWSIIDTPMPWMAINCDWCFLQRRTNVSHDLRTLWFALTCRYFYQCKICVTGSQELRMTATQPCDAWGDC